MGNKIINKIKSKNFSVSYEMFPPKEGSMLDEVYKKSTEIASLNPDFLSITYGAGGGVSENTLSVASFIQNELKVDTLAHLTCVSSTKETVSSVIDNLKANKINNILALRGDKPEGLQSVGDFKYASDLVTFIKSKGDFCIGGACYPEGHTECHDLKTDIDMLYKKVSCGVDFLTTQMFFNNDILYSYMDKITAKGVNVPVIAGIMPVTNGKQIDRICKLSGTKLPKKFVKIVEKFGDCAFAMEQAGINYACEQITDLMAQGISGVHIYTMNKPSVASAIANNIDKMVKVANGH